MNKRRYQQDYERITRKLNKLLSTYKSNEKTSEIGAKNAPKFSCDRAVFTASKNIWNIAAELLEEIILWEEKT